MAAGMYKKVDANFSGDGMSTTLSWSVPLQNEVTLKCAIIT